MVGVAERERPLAKKSRKLPDTGARHFCAQVLVGTHTFISLGMQSLGRMKNSYIIDKKMRNHSPRKPYHLHSHSTRVDEGQELNLLTASPKIFLQNYLLLNLLFSMFMGTLHQHFRITLLDEGQKMTDLRYYFSIFPCLGISTFSSPKSMTQHHVYLVQVGETQ